MSSTNKTTYYNLSQYIGTDKPTYLQDYNSDMSKIDKAIHDVNGVATTANQSAGSAEAKAEQANTNVTALQGRVGSVEGAVSNLQDKDATQDSEINNAKKLVNEANTTANNAMQNANNANIKIDSAKFSSWNTCTNINGNITANSAKVMFNRQLNMIAFDIDVSTQVAITNNDILMKLPTNIPTPSKTVVLKRIMLDAIEYHAEGYFGNFTMSSVTIDTNGYIHATLFSNSNGYVNGVFAFEEW
jgi:chromosome condensin MukBEF ATPase and DNA-binding subunit MukB